MRYSPYEIARRFSSMLLLVFLAARFLSAILPALNAQQAAVETTILLLCGVRLVFILIDLARRTLPWQRAVLPTIILLALAALFSSPQSRMLVKIATVTLELGILAFGLYAVFSSRKEDDGRPVEERLLEQMRLLVPLPLARFMVTEMLILHAAFSGLFNRAKKTPHGFTYTETSLFRILPLLILFCSPVDIVIVAFALKALHVNDVIWTAALTGADFYTLVWVYGALMTMRARPHKIAGQHLHIYKGVFGSATMALETIQSATVLPQSKSKKQDGHADLSLRRTAKIELQLNQPVQIVKWLVPEPGAFSRVTISADDPGDLCRAITRERDVAT